MDSASASLRDFLTSARWYQLLVVIGTLIASCVGIASLMREDQPLVIITLFLGVLAFPAAVINPRWGLLIFLWLAHTIDGAKRLIYTVTNFSQSEIAKILIVPVLVAGALYVRVYLLSWFGAGTVERVQLKRFVPLVVAIVGALAFTVRGGLSFDALVSNYTLICYIPAGIVVPHIIFDTRLRLQYVKVLITIAIILGFYGLVQAIHGPFDYEVEYMRSGLTITIGSLEGQSYFRGFSLMNNGPTYCGCMAMITLLSAFYFCRKEGRFRFTRPVVLMSIFTVICCFAATQRSALIVFLITLFLMPLIVRPRAFFVTIGIMLVGFLTLVIFAEEATVGLNALNHLLVTSTDNAFLQQNAAVITYAQRLNGFTQILNPELWTPFGISSRIGQVTFMANDIAGSHDLISNFLEWFGYVGTGLFLGFCGFFVYRVITRVRDMQAQPQRALWAQCNLAVFLFMMIWQITNGPALMVSPLQYYFWVAIGNVLYLLSEPEAEAKPADEERTRSPGIWAPGMGIREPVARPTA